MIHGNVLQMPDILLVAGSILFSLCIWIISISRTKKTLTNSNSLPPGPRRLPIIGNLLDMPKAKDWLTYTQWGKTYGPICYAEVLGRPYVILNSLEAISDLLEKRSANYSDRPPSIMMYEKMGFTWMTTMLPYGERFHKHRSLLRKYLQPSTAKNYYAVQSQMAHRLLGNLLDSPENFLQHIRSATGGMIMKVTYGHEVNSINDPFITLSDDALQWFSKVAVPGSYWVDYFPWLQYVPNWFPGGKWKNEGKIAFSLSRAMVDKPYAMAKENFIKGDGPPSILSDMLDSNTNDGGVIQDEDVISEVLTTLYAGGSDPTVSTIVSAVLAFLLFPTVIEKAQKEIDKVIGPNRLPTFDDRASLPYIEAILKEALRWNPVTPLGVTHSAVEDDVYNGYLIPAGARMIPNQWGILHDEKIYPESFKFRPERWLDDHGNLLDEARAPVNPHKVAFGFGRRLCPGKEFADSTAFIEIANMIAVFTFERKRDKNGNFLTPTANYRSGLISHPEPFECSIKVRSPAAELIIRQAVESAKSS